MQTGQCNGLIAGNRVKAGSWNAGALVHETLNVVSPGDSETRSSAFGDWSTVWSGLVKSGLGLVLVEPATTNVNSGWP